MSRAVQKQVCGFRNISAVKAEDIKITAFDHPFIEEGSEVDRRLDDDIQYSCSQFFQGNPDVNRSAAAVEIKKILRVLRDPLQVAEYLRGLDQALGDRLRKSGCEIRNVAPQFIIRGCEVYLPGPPPPEYVPHQKHKALDNILLAGEQAAGINLHGNAKFVGLVETRSANAFLAEGNLFGEDEQVGRMLLHGKYSHRLVFEIIRAMMNNGELTSFANAKEVLQLLLVGIDGTGDNLWNKIIDTDFDSGLESFCFSCRSPFVLKSLITCFGEELGLKNLQDYLLDSHYKEVAQMWRRSSKFEEMSFEEFYKYFAVEVSSVEQSGIVGLPGRDFLLSHEDASSLAKYSSLSGARGDNIKFKKERDREFTPYASVQEYAIAKFVRESGEKDPPSK
jgi:hypothetical protein